MPHRLENAVKTHEEPRSNWKWIAVTVMKSVDTYEEGLRYEEQAMYISDLGTENDEKRNSEKEKKKINHKRKRHSTPLSSEDESLHPVSKLPPFPTIVQQKNPGHQTSLPNLTHSFLEPQVSNINNPLVHHFDQLSPASSPPLQDIFNRSQEFLNRSQDISSRSQDISSRSQDISSRSQDISSRSQDISSRSHISNRSQDISSRSHISNRSQDSSSSRHHHIQLLPRPVSSTPLRGRDKNPEDSFQRKVLRMLEEIRQDVKDLKATKSNKNPLPQLPPCCPNLPCENPEDLAGLNVILEDEANFATICEYLSTIGGSSANDSTRRILKQLVSNKLALKYNWKGTRGEKLGFSAFKSITKLILGAVRNNPVSTLATEVEVNNSIKKYFMHAKDRDGGRNLRLSNVPKL